MFKKLRKNFILLNMTVITIVMLAAFAMVYITTYSNVQKENQTKLNSLEQSITILPGSGTDSETGMNSSFTISNVSEDYSLFFTLIIDETNSLVGICSSFDLPDDIYTKALDMIMQNPKSSTIQIDEKNGSLKYRPLEAQW